MLSERELVEHVRDCPEQNPEKQPLMSCWRDSLTACADCQQILCFKKANSKGHGTRGSLCRAESLGDCTQDTQCWLRAWWLVPRALHASTHSWCANKISLCTRNLSAHGWHFPDVGGVRTTFLTLPPGTPTDSFFKLTHPSCKSKFILK